eukprot:CAMPEP_0182418172 /NCGR_PEP_ID=MMETSP1167-20130531/2642_1 /TAXON_ID=2988 /ORGANISM="Mallomonas Sp, Strain CCMP3275" /LENGTH=522 /DNA_ID=CAMNT_0024592227 /DNA_START=252 /DNA_END=1820 /DNA_ORIENTATION=-
MPVSASGMPVPASGMPVPASGMPVSSMPASSNMPAVYEMPSSMSPVAEMMTYFTTVFYADSSDCDGAPTSSETYLLNTCVESHYQPGIHSVMYTSSKSDQGMIYLYQMSYSDDECLTFVGSVEIEDGIDGCEAHGSMSQTTMVSEEKPDMDEWGFSVKYYATEEDCEAEENVAFMDWYKSGCSIIPSATVAYSMSAMCKDDMYAALNYFQDTMTCSNAPSATNKYPMECTEMSSDVLSGYAKSSCTGTKPAEPTMAPKATMAPSPKSVKMMTYMPSKGGKKGSKDNMEKPVCVHCEYDRIHNHPHKTRNPVKPYKTHTPSRKPSNKGYKSHTPSRMPSDRSIRTHTPSRKPTCRPISTHTPSRKPKSYDKYGRMIKDDDMTTKEMKEYKEWKAWKDAREDRAEAYEQKKENEQKKKEKKEYKEWKAWKDAKDERAEAYQMKMMKEKAMKGKGKKGKEGKMSMKGGKNGKKGKKGMKGSKKAMKSGRKGSTKRGMKEDHLANKMKKTITRKVVWHKHDHEHKH